MPEITTAAPGRGSPARLSAGSANRTRKPSEDSPDNVGGKQGRKVPPGLEAFPDTGAAPPTKSLRGEFNDRLDVMSEQPGGAEPAIKNFGLWPRCGLTVEVDA
ncbi:hypothetical protein [Microtetraspora malaysiensis]|uniref:hypothetical protein n=1 Tax=Microtetraspora malaysiensis TaxID=161358 RepID=UPI000AD08CC8|nr:hypothetical protein [Microtetraspora malaysiensis]